MNRRNLFLRSICVYLVLIVYHVTAQKNSDCTTPNQEKAKCIPIQACTVIFTAIQTRNETAIKFAQNSQCGFDDRTPLVCCGTSAYPQDNLDFIYNIFNNNASTNNKPKPTEVPNRQTPSKEKQELEQIILLEFNTKALPDRTVCGLEKDENRIWGGEITELDEFPWMVALEYNKKKDGSGAGVRCGGSLINNRYVLTAAHCLVDREFEIVNVRLGEWDLNSDPDCHQEVAITECGDPVKNVKVTESIPHPFYSKKSGNNDIGLIRLAEDVSFTNYIRPICLPPLNLPAPAFNSNLTVAGWGITENRTTSDIKLKVDVPLIRNEVCREKLVSKPINANQLCAGGELGKDSCRGDSGGPLMRTYEDHQTKQSQWYQEGVVSTGLGCARLGYPAVYTRVSRYINWIITNISSD